MTIDQWVRKHLAAAPPLTDAQRVKIARILAGAA